MDQTFRKGLCHCNDFTILLTREARGSNGSYNSVFLCQQPPKPRARWVEGNTLLDVLVEGGGSTPSMLVGSPLLKMQVVPPEPSIRCVSAVGGAGRALNS